MAFHCGRRGGCGEAVVVIPVELIIGTQSSCCWGDSPGYLGAAALKATVGPVLRFGAVEITLLFFFFFKLHITPSSQITSSFSSEALNLEKSVHRIIGQFRLEGTLKVI